MKKVDVSVIIVGYNSQDTIVGCIESVLKTVKEHTFEIIISDNSPNSETEKVINDDFGKNEKIEYTHNYGNLGFSKANNIGVKKAHGKFVLFLNPDTKVYKKTIDGMIEFMKKNSACGASTCYVRLPNGQLDDSSHRGFPTPWRSLSYFSGLSKAFPKSKFFGGYNLSYLDINTTHEIESLAGSFMLVPYVVGEKIGWWDEDFFFYGEDIDFCYRLKEAGYKIYFVAEYEALHMKGISSGIKKVSQNITKASSETKRLATYHRYRAMEIFYNKHYKTKYPTIVNMLVSLGINVKKAIS